MCRPSKIDGRCEIRLLYLLKTLILYISCMRIIPRVCTSVLSLYSHDLEFLNDLECSLSNVYILLSKNNINKTEKLFFRCSIQYHRFHPLSKIVIHNSVIHTEVWMTILESGWNLWVWLVGVVSRRSVWVVGGIYGYGYNV